MHRLARFEVSRRYRRGPVRLLSRLAFGLFCTLAMISLRAVFDTFAPSSGPFALIYPTILLATLYGQWQGGAVAWATSFFWAWWYVLPYSESFIFENPGNGPRVFINGAAALVVLVFAESFRRAVAQATAQRDQEIERRDMLMREMTHRTKNNFALVASLLDIQKRREADASVRSTLDIAIGRVHSFAEAYAPLSGKDSDEIEVAMRPYLERLIERLAAASFDTRVRVRGELDDFQLPKEKAVAIGLIVNEALTNAAKYAFPEGRSGNILVRMRETEAGWSLEVRDDGIGRGGDTVKGSGVGSSLMEAFARQAEGVLEIESLSPGTCVRMVSQTA